MGGKEDLAEYRWRDTSNIDFFRFWSCKQTHMYMERLKGQLSVEYFVPKFVTDYNIKHYNALAEERKAMGMNTNFSDYMMWEKSFDRIIDEVLDSNIDSSIFLTFHAVYHHQDNSEIVSPINIERIQKLKGKVKSVIVFIDDILDIYR